MLPSGSCGEFLFDELMQMIANRRMIEALDYLVKESGDEEALGDFCGNAAGAKIKKFVFVDLAGGRAVGATDVIGENFQTGH